MTETHETRIKRLEQDMCDVRDDLKLILTNHLPHIQVEITKNSTLMKVYGSLIMAGITALILLGLTP